MLALTLLTLVAACGGGRGQATRPATGDADDRPSHALASVEEEVLRDLAAIDRRIERRAGLVASEDDLRRVAMTAVLREDPGIAVVDGRIDPFSFDARGRGLEAARVRVEMVREKSRARDLLAWVVRAEISRLDEERRLPRSASALVRAIVEGWTPPKTPRDAEEADRWLARRLAMVRESIGAASLDVVRARELDDALDALERLVAGGWVGATQELVRLREALEAAGSRPAPPAQSSWSTIAGPLHDAIGVRLGADELARVLLASEADLRRRAEAAQPGRDLPGSEVFAPGPCLDAVPGSRIRSLGAPAELAASCRLRHLVARADTDAARAGALVAMHDHVVIASWSVDVASGARTLAAAEGAHRLLAPVPPDARARLERIAVARPLDAIAAGETARILASGDPTARAAAWTALGNVPLDVAESELPR